MREEDVSEVKEQQVPVAQVSQHFPRYLRRSREGRILGEGSRSDRLKNSLYRKEGKRTRKASNNHGRKELKEENQGKKG